MDILTALEEEDIDHFIEIYQYLTGSLKQNQVQNVVLGTGAQQDIITGLKSPTYFGRPNFDQIFQAIKGKHRATDVGVFFCGPKPLSQMLHRCCNKYSDGGDEGTRFFYNKEHF